MLLCLKLELLTYQKMFKLHAIYCSIILFTVLTCLSVEGSDKVNEKSGGVTGGSDSREGKQTETYTGDEAEKTMSSITKFKKLFNEHRIIQMNAIKSLQQFGDYTQRFKLIEIMLQQLFSVMAQARANLTHWGHLPGDPFPENETIQESVSKVFENCAMFGDLVLRLPDIVHELYDKKREWQMTLMWALTFCNESLIIEGKTGTLLNLMAQEVNLIPRSPEYVNPFKAEALKKEQEKLFEAEQMKREKTKKKKKKLQRGPRLSRTEL